ncbi:FecR family protein [Mucilaginibacter lappiensis]|uniref:Ferric-dicitrate binding protein FerR (Iron transport regulator) n=1 Tax=Mucilaginibacter lappiensis TaxID=354630 RepID=A0ABR6PG36_9SPHI|nr:FecR family protein [Mucilaginibacter lappiensis]MBB6108730.1 ferric-dicitrate binding protein FerR (iron transport regulator) [Mucilaginibacter lappiensis]SIQ26255.1 FecR family protein [Mucilaginibacter lappiensis]
MDQETLWTLLGKKLNKEATPEELRQLDILLAQPWADAYTIQVLEALWQQNPDQPPRFISHKLQEKWDRLENKLETDNHPTDSFQSPEDKADSSAQIRNIWSGSTRLSIAAACLVFGLLSFFCWRSFTGDSMGKTYQIAAPLGGISKIILPDGSKVWLNAGSEIFYGTNYGNKYREIRLTGEAFFDVVKDSEHPFIVNTTTMQIKVLGTAFNVRSYANDNASETSLIRGRIELTPVANPDHKIILKPSEKLTIPNKIVHSSNVNNTLITLSSLHHEQNDSLPSEAQWLENKLVFDDEYFDDVAKKMERWYGVSISFKNEELKQKKFSGKFTKESLATALDALKATSNFNFLIDNDKVVIY